MVADILLSTVHHMILYNTSYSTVPYWSPYITVLLAVHYRTARRTLPY